MPDGASLFVCAVWAMMQASGGARQDEPATPRRQRRGGWRGRAVSAAFELLYRNRTLYWLASTIPFAGQWRVWQRRVLPRLRGTDVLEVGCGIGTLLADLLAAGYRCRAVDASPEMVAATRARLRRHGYPEPDVTVRLARVQQLPFADASFDTVISTFPTPYIYDPGALAELARVLRPGGRLVVVEGGTLLPANLLLRLLAGFQAAVYGASAAAAVPADGRGGARRDKVRTLPVTPARSRIPLEPAGFSRREEMDLAPWWALWVVVADKPEAS